MPTNYVPRHKRPTPYAGNTPRGPERWARAAANAITSPNSEAARLYQRRVQLACEYRDLQENIRADELPIAFERWGGGRDYVVCSHYCAAMQAQLDRRASTLAGVVSTLRGNDVEVNPTLTRDVRCQCCASTIRRRR